MLSSILVDWFLPFLATISILALSTVLLVTSTKKKVDAPASEELFSETETVLLEKTVTHQVTDNPILHEKAEIDTEMESGSDDEDSVMRSQNVGLDWFCGSNVDEESTETSDDSITASSDDEDDSLIEIALPKQKVGSNLHADIEELLQEMNEEDSLIEIDISKFDL